MWLPGESMRRFQVTMPLPKKMFAAAAETYWKNYGRKHGVTKEQMETMKIES